MSEFLYRIVHLLSGDAKSIGSRQVWAKHQSLYLVYILWCFGGCTNIGVPANQSQEADLFGLAPWIALSNGPLGTLNARAVSVDHLRRKRLVSALGLIIFEGRLAAIMCSSQLCVVAFVKSLRKRYR